MDRKIRHRHGGAWHAPGTLPTPSPLSSFALTCISRFRLSRPQEKDREVRTPPASSSAKARRRKLDGAAWADPCLPWLPWLSHVHVCVPVLFVCACPRRFRLCASFTRKNARNSHASRRTLISSWRSARRHLRWNAKRRRSERGSRHRWRRSARPLRCCKRFGEVSKAARLPRRARRARVARKRSRCACEQTSRPAPAGPVVR